MSVVLIGEFSETGRTTALANASMGALNAKSVGSFRYYLHVDDPALVGFLTLIIRWKHRDGSQKEHRSTTLSLAAVAETGAEAMYYTEDNPLGSEFEMEIEATSAIGSFAYSYWVRAMEEGVGA